MVRGPMIAGGDGRVVDDERDGEVDEGQALLFGELGQVLRRSRVCAGWLRWSCRSAPSAGPPRWGSRRCLLAPAAGQPATTERAVGEDAHAVPMGGGQDVGLDAAHHDRVRRLLGDEPFQPAVAGGPLGLDDLAGGVRRGSDVADLALPDEIGEGAEGFLDVGVLARAGGPGRGRCSRFPAGGASPRPTA